jgi:predicted MFS family arabinose efflux permease
MSRAVGVGSYRAVLALPFALRTFAPALGGRLAYGLLPLATLFTIIDATGSYATAGLALALFGLTSITLPAKARLADRLGHRRTLPVLAVVCAAALTAAVTTRSPVAVVTLIGLAGLAAPPLGPAMRSTWRRLTEGTGLKERAYGLDSVAEETLYLVGPLLAGLLVALGPARNALLVTAFLLTAGTIGMVLPPPARHRSESDRRPGWDLGPLRSAALWPILAVLLVAGAGVSVAYTAAAAVARNHGSPGAAGWLEAAAALGGVIGGLVWARRRHRHRRAAHLAGLLAAQAGAAGLAASVTGSLPALAVIMAFGGAAVSPLYVVAYLAADDLAPDGPGTEAGAWVNVVANAGSAGGSAAAGLLVQSSGPAWAFLAAGVVLAVFALVNAVPAVRNRGTTSRTSA